MKAARALLAVVVLASLGLALSACKPSGQGTSVAPSSKETPAGKEAVTAQPAKEAPEVGKVTPPVEAPIKLGTIFAVTGPAAFLGAPEQKTVEMLVEAANAAGGLLGRKIELIARDSKGDPQVARSLAQQLIEEEKVSAILGPSTSGETLQIKDMCQAAGMVLISCAAAEAIVDPLAPFVFKTPQKDSDAARLIYKTMKGMGITKIGVIASNTGFGNEGRKQLEKLAGEFGITIAIAETYDKAATDLTGVLSKVKGEGVQAVVNWSIEPAQAIVAKNMKQLEFAVPLFQSHGFGNIKYVEMSGEAANGLLFPAGRLLVADSLPDDHPQKKVLTSYKNDYEGRYGEPASTFGGHAYDAFLVFQEAVKKAGSAEPSKVRDAIETLQGVVGTGGVFNYGPKDHNGLGVDAFEMLTVQGGKFVLSR